VAAWIVLLAGRQMGKFISLVFSLFLITLHGAELGPWNRTSCGAHKCINSQKLSKKLSKDQCVAGVYSDYCDYQEYLCCEETSKCHSKLGKCIDLRSHKCKSGKLVLGYCEDWEDTPYTAFCCDAGESDYKHGVFVTGWVFFALWIALLCFFTLVLIGAASKEDVMNFSCGFFMICFPITLILTGMHYHLNGNTVSVILGWSWVASVLAILFSISICDETKTRKWCIGLFVYLGLIFVLLLAIEGTPDDPIPAPLYSHVPPHPTRAPSPTSPTLFPTSASPTLPPTSASPTISPTSYPSTNPTVSSLPTSFPTASPTLNPTVSVHPTSTCGAGYYLADEGCVACGMGSYTNEPNQQSCRACEKWTYNHESGSQACPDATTRNILSREYPVAVCLLYIFLSLVCYVLSIGLGAGFATIITIALITSDQVSDILYAWYSVFASPSLLYSSLFFCIANLVGPMMYIFWYTKLSNLLVLRWIKKCSDFYDAYDRAHGHYGEDEQPRYGAWILSRINDWDYLEFFPFSILFIPIDILWIGIRILLILLIILAATLCQPFLLLIGVVFYVTKLMSIPAIGTWFWTAWNPSYLETHPQVTSDDSTLIYNALILLELISECVPQILIQVANTSFILGNNVHAWPPLTLISISLSLSMILSIFFHFGYKHFQLLEEDPTYTKFDLRRIPKFDLYEKMNGFFRNRRRARRVAAINQNVQMPQIIPTNEHNTPNEEPRPNIPPNKPQIIIPVQGAAIIPSNEANNNISSDESRNNSLQPRLSEPRANTPNRVMLPPINHHRARLGDIYRTGRFPHAR
jgi:hypothetical protein